MAKSRALLQILVPCLTMQATTLLCASVSSLRFKIGTLMIGVPPQSAVRTVK